MSSFATMGATLRRAWTTVVLGLLAAAAAAAPPAAEDFVRRPALDQVKPSPSGQRLAMVVATNNGRNALAVLDLPPTAPPRIVAQYGDGDIESFQWINDDRLAYFLAEPGARVRSMGAGLLAVDHDGKNERSLIAWRSNITETTTARESRVLDGSWRLLRTLDDGSADVIVAQTQWDNTGEAIGAHLARLNTRDGRLTRLGGGLPGKADSWLFDARGELRALRHYEGPRVRLLVRAPGSDSFEVVDERNWVKDDGLLPLFLDGDDTLVVRTTGKGSTFGLYTYDLKQRRLSDQPLAQVARYDIGRIETDAPARRIVGVHLVADRPMTLWFSDKLQRLQAAVDGALPGRFNTLACGRCESSAFYVVHSRSDQHPGEYHLFDATRRTLTRLGTERPWLDPATQARRSFHWIAARDGLQMPVVVTHPAGRGDKEALPTVLLVHGGPWARGGSRAWDAESQFLASRGWRVLAPEFRGSSGFGARLFNAGLRQWGRAMQDDLVDALDWAVREGLVDKDRVCIYGGSYGGYAALMAPATHPGRFRCAASFAGVTDIRQMFSSVVGDWSRDARSLSLVEWIGDPVKDAEALRRVSPVERVAEIKVPVLLVQGSLDQRVPQEQADLFTKAARAAGVALERVDIAEAGHGFAEPQDHADFLRRLEAFLARSLAP